MEYYMVCPILVLIFFFKKVMIDFLYSHQVCNASLASHQYTFSSMFFYKGIGHILMNYQPEKKNLEFGSVLSNCHVLGYIHYFCQRHH